MPNYLPDGPLDHINPTANLEPFPTSDTAEPPVQPGIPVDPFIVAFNSTNLPYLPGKTPLEAHRVSINALHYNNILEFDVHPLNGMIQSQSTYQSLYELTNKRPFILSRSNHVGSGQFAAHWTGDNRANWTMLALSIPGIFNFQLYGIPMVGTDICGFASNTTAELCARWMQLGAFYPFMRNHNALGNIAQEPYALGPIVEQTSKASLLFRYSILKFYYSIFIRNNQIGTVFRPMFFDFADEALLDLQTQFLIGSELLVAAVICEGANDVEVYFPSNSKWFDFTSGDLIIANGNSTVTISVPAPLNTILPVFIKAGSIVHTQNVNNVLNSADLNSEFKLVIALQQANEGQYTAKGHMMGVTNYQDDGSIESCIGENDCLVKISAEANVNENGIVNALVSFDRNQEKTILEEVYITEITFYGVRTELCGAADQAGHCQNQVVSCLFAKPRLLAPDMRVQFLLGTGNCQEVVAPANTVEENGQTGNNVC